MNPILCNYFKIDAIKNILKELYEWQNNSDGISHDRAAQNLWKPAWVGIGSPSCGGQTNFSLRSTFSPIASSLSESWINPSGLPWLGSSAVIY